MSDNKFSFEAPRETPGKERTEVKARLRAKMQRERDNGMLWNVRKRLVANLNKLRGKQP